ncbi:unnamed protein product [Miscanthus lutarioriparius]|uniref:Uncharacterized protein n=1 Tax=Miscanthus lutarioriparius TaxID=422564 RepID=A0A811Q552_9POAL|nr:unnamed protein product [Miscanthus lutarioriparius]
MAGAATPLVWDHVVGAARLPFYLPSSTESRPTGLPRLDSPCRIAATAFGSDDELVDLELRVEISSITGIEDALLLKPASGKATETWLRVVWAHWMQGKADYLRRWRKAVGACSPAWQQCSSCARRPRRSHLLVRWRSSAHALARQWLN